jgi:hypothetical protein
MTVLERMKVNGISTTYLAKLFNLNRSKLHLSLIGEVHTYDKHMTAIIKYIESVEEVNNKFRRL